MTVKIAPASPTAPSAVAQGLIKLMLSMLSLYTQESRKAGLTAQQTQLLCAASHREVGLSEMAEVLHCDPSNVSRLLDRVANRGLAYRGNAERDGRVSVVKLTGDGERLVDRVETDLATRLNRLVAAWPSRKQSVIADALDELVEAIRDDIAAPEEPAGPRDKRPATTGSR